VTEAIGLADEWRSDIGLGLLPVVVNSCWTDRPGLAKSPAMAARSQKVTLSPAAKHALASSADFGRERLERQRHQIDRIKAELGLPMARLPRLATPRLTIHDLGTLADALAEPLEEPGA
jgi:hypothetical protein